MTATTNFIRDSNLLPSANYAHWIAFPAVAKQAAEYYRVSGPEVQYRVGELLITYKLTTYKLITDKLITTIYKLITNKLITKK